MLFIAQWSLAQNRFGIMPQINADFKVGTALKVNAKQENRFILHQNPFSEAGARSRYERSDLELLVSGRRGVFNRFGLGYLIRRSDQGGTFLHRSIQQFSTSGSLGSLLLAHRFRTDQTFELEKPVKYRLRYRLSLEVPLNGQQVDAEEFYLKFNNEYLGALQDGIGNFEIRLLTGLGYNISEKDQIELGLDYRAESLVQDNTEHLLWLTVGWYHSF